MEFKEEKIKICNKELILKKKKYKIIKMPKEANNINYIIFGKSFTGKTIIFLKNKPYPHLPQFKGFIYHNSNTVIIEPI